MKRNKSPIAEGAKELLRGQCNSIDILPSQTASLTFWVRYFTEGKTKASRKLQWISGAVTCSPKHAIVPKDATLPLKKYEVGRLGINITNFEMPNVLFDRSGASIL